MLKCVVLSLHRSGTRSTTELLGQLGLATTHWPAYHNGIDVRPQIAGRETQLEAVYETIAPIVDDSEAVADVPFPVLYPQLHERFPAVSYILVQRDPQRWLESVRKHGAGRQFGPYERVQYWQYFPERPGTIDALADRDLLWMQEEHRTRVERFFADREPDRLRTLTLEDPDVATKIAAFLGYEEAGPLPHVVDPPEGYTALRARAARGDGD
jgi:hypothetical protein